MLVFSIITLGSSVETAGDMKDRTTAQSWAVCVSALSFLISGAALVFHLWSVMSVLFVGTKLEGGLAFFLMIGWVAGVAVVTDSEEELAVNEEGVVTNGNLYYFGWASLVCSVTIVTNYLQSVYSIDVAGEIHNKAKRMTLWSSMLVISIIVMSSSSTVYENVCSSSPRTETSKYCDRAGFAISVGVIGSLTSLGFVAMKISDNVVPFFYEGLSSIGLLVFYALGVAFITSNDGPGAPLGNLYYSSWAGFLFTSFLVKSCFEDYQAAKAMSEQQQNTNGEGYDTNIQVETMEGDEQI